MLRKVLIVALAIMFPVLANAFVPAPNISPVNGLTCWNGLTPATPADCESAQAATIAPNFDHGGTCTSADGNFWRCTGGDCDSGSDQTTWEIRNRYFIYGTYEIDTTLHIPSKMFHSSCNGTTNQYTGNQIATLTAGTTIQSSCPAPFTFVALGNQSACFTTVTLGTDNQVFINLQGESSDPTYTDTVLFKATATSHAVVVGDGWFGGEDPNSGAFDVGRTLLNSVTVKDASGNILGGPYTPASYDLGGGHMVHEMTLVISGLTVNAYYQVVSSVNAYSVGGNMVPYHFLFR